jgi:hypothetical protein
LCFPQLELLENRCTPSVLTVANNHDAGPGSLRAEIAAAQTGDMIVFAPSLAGATIALKSQIKIDKALDIEGLGADQLAISGEQVTRIFNIHKDAAAVTIAGLTLENGQARQGGAIIDRGASLTLTSDTFTSDQAVCKALGKNGAGGALAVLGLATTGMRVTITECQFMADFATGAAGGVDATGYAYGGADGLGGAIFVAAGKSVDLTLSVVGSGFTSDVATGGNGLDGVGTATGATYGGFAQGGALYLAANQANNPSFSLFSDSFFGCAAIGGAGGNGAKGNDGGNGAGAGGADGGAIWYNGDLAAVPMLSVTKTSFYTNGAFGGNGGAGGRAMTSLGTGDNGGSGGSSSGGALRAVFSSLTAGAITLAGDDFHYNGLLGGNGGVGGAGGSVGGGGGLGGGVTGGAISVGDSTPQQLIC